LENNFIICSFITKNTNYEKIIEKYLLKSIKKLKLPFHVEIMEDLGSWIRNTSQKPIAILNCLEKFPNKNIVYLDSNCVIRDNLTLFDKIPEEYDLGAHYLDLNNYYDTNKKELLTSVLFLRNNFTTRDIVKKWNKKCQEGIFWEQRELELILSKEKGNVYELPFKYSYTTSLPKPKYYIKFIPPIIIKYPIYSFER